MNQQKLKLSIEIEKGCDLSMTLEDVIKSFLDNKTKCERCEKEISQKEKDYSKKNYNRILCIKCQKMEGK